MDRSDVARLHKIDRPPRLHDCTCRKREMLQALLAGSQCLTHFPGALAMQQAWQVQVTPKGFQGLQCKARKGEIPGTHYPRVQHSSPHV